jgi:DNA-binding NarL/FixJ family response regulator
VSIRIFLVGDQSLIGHKVEAASRRDPEIEVAGAGQSPQEILEGLRVHCPDVVIIHPQGAQHATEMIRPVKDLCPQTPVLLFTTTHNRDIQHMAGTSGVAGYMLSDISPENLVRIIREVHQGRTTAGPGAGDLGPGQTFIARTAGPTASPRS